MKCNDIFLKYKWIEKCQKRSTGQEVKCSHCKARLYEVLQARHISVRYKKVMQDSTSVATLTLLYRLWTSHSDLSIHGSPLKLKKDAVSVKDFSHNVPMCKDNFRALLTLPILIKYLHTHSPKPLIIHTQSVTW